MKQLEGTRRQPVRSADPVVSGDHKHVVKTRFLPFRLRLRSQLLDSWMIVILLGHGMFVGTGLPGVEGAPRNIEVMGSAKVGTTLLPSKNSTENEIGVESCPRADQEYVSPVHGQPHCCTKCPTGEGMLRLCTDSRDTSCRSCKPGTEFSPIESAMDKCLQCKQCEQIDQLARNREECTPFKDSVCECIPGFYFSDKRQNCAPCTKCPVGQGALEACTFNEDTICRPCEDGFFSDDLAALKECRKCQSCSADDVVVMPCSTSSDTICCPKNQPNCADERLGNPDTNRTNPLSQNNGQQTDWKSLIRYHEDGVSNQKGLGPGAPNITREEVDDKTRAGTAIPYGNLRGNELIPLYCAIMGLVIVGLVVYVVYKHWRQRQNGDASKLAAAANGGGFTGLAPGTLTAQHQKMSSIPGMGFGPEHPLIRVVSGPGEANRRSISPRHDESLFNELPEKIVREMETSISETKNGIGWRDLAAELGYTQAEMTALESESNSGAPSSIRCLLNDWTPRDTATVAKFARALHKIGRRDTLALLRNSKEHHINENSGANSTVMETTPPPVGTVCTDMGHV